jgi:hypothetical protein
VRWLHHPTKIHATFDDPNLVSRAGLVPVMALTQRAGLAGLVDEHVRMARPCGVNPQVKVPCVVAGMIGGADSIDDLGLLRHGAMGVAFVEIDSQQTRLRPQEARRGVRPHQDLIDVAARTARHGHGHITVHLPKAGTASRNG